MPTRRTVLRSALITAGGVGAAAISTPASAPVSAATPIPKTGAHLVLLGTAAGPVPMPGRTGIATALVVDGRIYLIDLGHGSFDQFEKSGLSPAAVERVFVTHMHSDHLADLFAFFWLRFGGVNPLTHRVNVHGPAAAGALPRFQGATQSTVNPASPTPGLAAYWSHSLQASAYDINIRMRDEGWPDITTMVAVHEIPTPTNGASPSGPLAPRMQPFEVMRDENVRVTAILVDHPPVFPSYAFRFDTRYGSVAFSGDTTITANMVTLARGADILVHEAIDIEAVRRFGNLTPAQTQHHERSHSDVRRIGGEVAAKAGVGTLVLTHLAPGTKQLPDALWHAQASIGFRGKVIVGNDLMRIPLTKR